ncbi:hypothetical protein JW988_03465 [Candidatus Bathyarchaeota archaeon]|nr:hypothetical protein [Candidatus Bathyarchaeota archaeon]
MKKLDTTDEEPETEVETESPKMLKQPETNSETQESPITASLVNQVFCFRQEGKTYRQIASETGLSIATISRMLKGIPEDTSNKGQAEAVLQVLEPEQDEELQIPKGYTLAPSLSAAEWAEISKFSKNKLISEVGRLKAELQTRGLKQHKWNGDSPANASSTNPEAEFWAEMARTEKIERFLRLRDRYSDKKGEYPADIKNFLELYKVLAPKQESVDELGIYRLGRVDEQKNLQNAVKTGVETNMLDLRLEEMRQRERLENKKLDWEIEKHQERTLEDGRKWQLLESLMQGPLGDVLKNAGSAATDRLRARKPPKVIPIDCPQCKKKIFVDETSSQCVCGRCGAVLVRANEKPPPQQPPEPPTIPEKETETDEEEGEKSEK